ncbi:MAG: nucleotidyltransferase family protein [Mizugakiibacter sp.]|uniref:nucleotidyltransferase family protein n=1 Tax=Mizugakiibacter sp. TaxID=1972610 RepID=UPI0031BE1A5E|nr:nucleotidyltransferase family protein [Xanthomonadaceae bacterium]
MPEPRHGVVLLAAGASRRLGRPKQLVAIDGEPLVRRAARLALATVPADAVVVLGADATAVAAAVRGLAVRPLRAPGWEHGMGASLRAGLDALAPACAGALVLLCDQPALDAAHLEALLAAWRLDPAGAAASAYAGVLGVPAVLPRAWFPHVDAGADRGARDLLRSRAAAVRAVPRAALADDLDTPDRLP